jgi:capsular polysaccharide transport system permease protein
MGGLEITTRAKGSAGQSMRSGSGALGQVLPRIAHHLPFGLFVVLPTLLASIYYGVIATDQYVSEARFIISSPNRSAPGLLSNFLQSTGISRAQDDTFAVQDYIRSRDAVSELAAHHDLAEVFSRPEGDLLSRFPSPLRGHTFEHLYRHYLRQVELIYDSTTGVTTLKVRAYRAEDARSIAFALLDAAEHLVNRLNDRARANSLRYAEADVARMEHRVADVNARIAAFRTREIMLDPTRQSVILLEGISVLQKQLAQEQIKINELNHGVANSPLLEPTQRRAAALSARIEEEMRRIAGPGGSMVPKITEYDALMLEREFADRGLASATTSLETVRSEVQRQALYLDRIVEPNLADYPLYPRRVVSVVIVLTMALLIYSLGQLVVAGLREHRIH